MDGTKRWVKAVARIVTWVLLAFVAVRLAPHVAALLGIETGAPEWPSYNVRTLDGRLLSAESLRGKVVLVNFWATWCPPCRVEMPLLQRMAERHAKEGLVVLGLSVDRGPEEDVRRFLTERGITYPVAVVDEGMARAFGGVRGYPTSFLIDRHGKVRHEAMGPLAMISFEPAVRRLLEK